MAYSLRPLSVSLIALMLASGCQDNAQPKTTTNPPQTDKNGSVTLAKMMAEQGNKKGREEAASGLKDLVAGRYQEASRTFNTLLFDDPTNSGYHTLNAVTYHMIAKSGDVTQFDLAESGYMQALKFDPNNTYAWLQLGRLKVDKKDYAGAQDDLANVLLIEPNNMEAAYELSMASYLLGDLKTAKATIKRVLAHSKKANKPAFRAAALIYAAAGDETQAQKYLELYLAQETNQKQKNYVARRVEDWKNLRNNPDLLVAQADTTSTEHYEESGPIDVIDVQDTTGSADPAATVGTPTATTPTPPATPTPTAAKAADVKPADPKKKIRKRAFVEPQENMVVIDAVVMRVSEEGRTTKGNNILDNFSVTLAPFTQYTARKAGGSISGTVFPGGAAGGSVTGAAPTNGTAKLFTQGISFGSITYSMKIANARDTYVEVVGRPTMTTFVGKPSSFFSGDDIKIAVSGNFSGSVTTNPTGNTLDITPLSLENGFVTLEVTFTGSLLTTSLNELVGGAATQIKPFKIARSSIKTTVRVKLGETIMLGGTQERILETSKEGFPLLKDIPGIQYLFSQENSTSVHKSVIYLLTPKSHREYTREVKSYFAEGDNEGLYRPNLTELEMRHKDWFDPSNTQITLLRQVAPLYREFRTGDVLPEQWYHPDSISENLTQLADFLWY